LLIYLLAGLNSGVQAATPTENLRLSVLPAPGPVTVDGHTSDWDLSGGLFACSGVETLRDKVALWFHAMYDAKNLYVLARFTDETPLNNPGSTAGGDTVDLQLGADAKADPKRTTPV